MQEGRQVAFFTCAEVALQDLDPTGKFSSVADVWSFSAADTSTGATVPFPSCCNAQVQNFTPCAASHVCTEILACSYLHTGKGIASSWWYLILNT